MAKYLGIGTQLLKEKMGKASSQIVETKEFLESKEDLFATRDAFKSIMETTASVYKHTKTHIPAQEFHDNYIKTALKCEKDYRFAKLDLDSKNSALAAARAKGKQEKLPAAQAKADQAAAVFESAKTALIEAIATVVAGREEAYQSTIDTACKALQDLQPGWEGKNEGGAEEASATGTGASMASEGPARQEEDVTAEAPAQESVEEESSLVEQEEPAQPVAAEDD